MKANECGPADVMSLTGRGQQILPGSQKSLNTPAVPEERTSELELLHKQRQQQGRAKQPSGRRGGQWWEESSVMLVQGQRHKCKCNRRALASEHGGPLAPGSHGEGALSPDNHEKFLSHNSDQEQGFSEQQRVHKWCFLVSSLAATEAIETKEEEVPPSMRWEPNTPFSQ